MSSMAELPGVIGRFWLTVVSRAPGDDCAMAGATEAQSAAIAAPARRCFIFPPFFLRLNRPAT
jgi:hypothetical protein